MESRALFLAIKPWFVDRFVKGDKTIELRRVRPRVSSGAPVVIYASSPRMAVEATALVDKVEAAPPHQLWSLVREGADCTRTEFNIYYARRDESSGLISMGYGIKLRKFKPLPSAIPLQEIRSRIPDFKPPQGYLYVDHLEEPWASWLA